MIGEILLVVALGVVAGATAGLFGVGGGIVFVPALTILLGLSQVVAEGTSLVAIIPVAILGSWQQTRAGTVHWPDAAAIGAASVAAAAAGAVLADAAPESALRVAFALLLVVTAAQLALRARRAGRSAS